MSFAIKGFSCEDRGSFGSKGGVLGLERFYEKSYAYIGGENNGNICAFSIGFMFTSHLHLFLWMSKGAHDIFILFVNF
jgi:hypothetical protein